MKFNRVLLFKIIFLTLITSVCAGLLMITVRVMFPNIVALERGEDPALTSQFGHTIDPNSKLLHFVPRPYTGFQNPGNVSESGDFSGVRYKFKTNNFGFLTKYDVAPIQNLPIKKNSRDRLVIVTGGSAAWGWGASSNEQTFPYILENILNSKDPDHQWFVLNLAMGTWIAYQEFLALDIYASNLKPDWIVTFDGRNDIMVPTLHGERVPNYYFFSGQEKLHNLFDSVNSSRFEKAFPLLRYKQIATKINQMAIAPEPFFDEDEVDKAVVFYTHSIQRIVTIFNQSKLLLITQPTTTYFTNSKPMSGLIKGGYDQIFKNLKELAANHRGIQYLNGYEWFRRSPEAFLVDDCHMSDKGHNFVADQIAQVVLSSELKH